MVSSQIESQHGDEFLSPATTKTVTTTSTSAILFKVNRKCSHKETSFVGRM